MRCAILLFLVVLLVTWSGCVIPAPKDVGVPAGTAPGEVNFELAPPNDAAIIVPVKINGHGPYDFVLDTGATFTCIDQKLVNELKLPESRDQFGVGVLTPIEGAVKLVNIDTLEVGNVKATQMKACAIEFSRLQTDGLDAHGLVGLNFLKSFRMTIDFKKQVLHLDRP